MEQFLVLISVFLKPMQVERTVSIEKHVISSLFLDRDVIVDVYLPAVSIEYENVSLLLINDGQNLEEMEFENILDEVSPTFFNPLMCIGIHCGTDRKNEYGAANVLDYKGRGTKANEYAQFIFEELLPFIRTTYNISSFKEKSFCGFSLGGLSALDITLNHPHEFCKVGVFSGSLWWRTVSQTDKLFDENKHRIMHNKVRESEYYPWLKFFFEVGTQDEIADRNNNGIIDAIDDTITLIDELIAKGYDGEKDIFYLELSDGKHDVPTWAKALPIFLKWGWGGN